MGKNLFVSNDSIHTRLNNNDLIVGPSGAGKTRGYVIPQIEQMCGSMIVADTKNNLYRQYRSLLENNGYRVYKIDFLNPENSALLYLRSIKTVYN